MNFKGLKNNKYLYLITLTYFLLGLIDVHFGLLGIICMIIPFYLLFLNNKKTYCQGYCPRASLLSEFGRRFNVIERKTVPRHFHKGDLRWYIFGYFTLNLVFIIMSTTYSYYNQRSILNLRFLLFFDSFSLPTLLNLTVPVWAPIHTLNGFLTI